MTYFKRGWLPEIIPRSATEIVVNNNLDLNESSEASFYPMMQCLILRRGLNLPKSKSNYYMLVESEWFFDFSDRKIIYYRLRPLPNKIA